MELPNQPIASPEGPVVVPGGMSPLDVDSPPVAAPEAPGVLPGVVGASAPSLPAQERSVATTLGADLISSMQSLLGTVVIAIFVITFIVQAFQIPSESMENTLLVGDYLLVNKLCYGGPSLGDHLMPYQKISRGDIIVFHYPVDPTQHFVKRVIGIPGDRLRMISKRVWINGTLLDEPYVRFLEPANDAFRDNFPRTDIPAARLVGSWWLEMRKLMDDGQLIIPQGQYFVMGDNRDDSEDSRYWGFVPRENIIGRPLVIYWSVQDWDSNPSPSIEGRLNHLAYAVLHFFKITRWNRTLRLVH